MLSEFLLRSLGISESDAPYVNLERDWDIIENPDSTPQSPSCCVQGEVVLRPWAKRPEERVQWVHPEKQRPQVIGDLFIRMATTTKQTVKDCLLKCGSEEECHCSEPDPEDPAVMVPLSADQWRAYTICIADDPLSCIAAHSLLAANARRRTPDDKKVQNYLHFCFISNPRKFDKPVRQLSQIVRTLITVPGTDYKACQRSFAICNRRADVLFLSMPQLEGITSVYDFVTRYQLTPDERAKYSGSKASMLFDLMAGAISIDPFKRSATIDKKTGAEKDYNFQLQIRSAWLLMQSRGYVRVIDPKQPDKVGRYYKVTGNIVDEVNRESLMARCTEVLTDYALSKSRFGTPDFEKMAQAIRTAKTLSAATAIDLPVIRLDNRAGCSRFQDHFFFRNGALRMQLLPDGRHSIELIPYDKLDFFVKAPKILQWDFSFSDAFGADFKENSITLPSTLREDNTAPLHAPFLLYENPEYKQKRDALEADLREHRISPKEHSRLSRDLYDWARINRFVFQPSDADWHHWWPFMKVIRCYANEDWEEEQELEYRGEHFSQEQQDFLYGRIKNLLGTIGRIVYRYRTPNYLHYLMENNVTSEGKAQGGSGKSRFVRTFISCVRNVKNVDSKIFSARNDIETSVVFNGYNPDEHDVVHIEDYERDISRFYNYITGDFSFRKFHTNETVIPAAEAPSIVISSNYAVKDGLDDSSAGRLNLCGFSHYFHRENENLNLMERGFDVVMPDFQKEPEDLTPQDRSQIILVCALSVLFCMETQDKVLAPAKNLKERNLRSALTDSFYEWASDFFSHPYNLGVPIDFASIFEDYKEISQASDDKQNKFSPKAFTDRIKTYCQANDLAFMPDVVYKTETDRRRKCLNVKCWVTKHFFADEKVWGKNREKVCRELETSRKVVCFYPADHVPQTYDEVLQGFIRFWDAPDPEPYLDDLGNPVTLTEQERHDWNVFMSQKQGKGRGSSSDATPAAPASEAVPANSFTQAPQPQQQEELTIPAQLMAPYQNQQPPQDPNLPF